MRAEYACCAFSLATLPVHAVRRELMHLDCRVNTQSNWHRVKSSQGAKLEGAHRTPARWHEASMVAFAAVFCFLRTFSFFAAPSPPSMQLSASELVSSELAAPPMTCSMSESIAASFILEWRPQMVGLVNMGTLKYSDR